MTEFIKTEGENPSVPKLSGFQKVAIFLGEIGSAASQPIIARLNLSDKQLILLNKAFKSLNLGGYNPHNEFQVRRENSVLEEAAAYGKMHGIYHEKPRVTPEQQKVNSFANQNPEDVAKFLSALLKND